MPYAFAHPAAVVPVARLLGSAAVPSALVIGSMVPDAWYFVPGVKRGDTHHLLGVLWFCLPAGLVAYAAFHLLFKEPLLALLPRRLAARLAAWATHGLPPVPWRYVVGSLLAGIATHLLWDAFTHKGTLPVTGMPHRILQHASTIGGTVFLAWWLSRKIAQAPARSGLPQIDARIRAAVLAAMVVLPCAAFVSVLQGVYIDELRAAVRAAGVVAVSTFGLIALVFAVAWKVLAPHFARHFDH